MSGKIEARLKELGIELPQATAPIANYVPFTRAGNLVVVSGQVSVRNGRAEFVGKLGAGITTADGQQAAKLCALNILAHLKTACDGDLDKVKAGIEAAQAAGLAVKINAVALKNINEDEIPSLMQWAHGSGMALTLIEVMPMGDIGEGRIDQYLPLSLLRARLAQHYTLTDLDEDTGGPARYVRVSETGGKLGFITPMTHNFCESCNRVRITCTGTLHTCLGHEDASDLRKPLRASADDDLLSAAIDRSIGLKPKGHDFIIDRRHNRPSVSRHMSVTGG